MENMKIFLKWLEKNNWKFKITETPSKLPTILIEKYKNLPKEWIELISNFEYCNNSSETCWFLTYQDYSDENSGNFKYDDFELMSLEYFKDDLEETQNVKQFWSNHLPFVMGVNPYEYYAINTNNGHVVNGYEPEFEDVSVVAKTFKEFIMNLDDFHF